MTEEVDPGRESPEDSVEQEDSVKEVEEMKEEAVEEVVERSSSDEENKSPGDKTNLL